MPFFFDALGSQNAACWLKFMDVLRGGRATSRLHTGHWIAQSPAFFFFFFFGGEGGEGVGDYEEREREEERKKDGGERRRERERKRERKREKKLSGIILLLGKIASKFFGGQGSQYQRVFFFFWCKFDGFSTLLRVFLSMKWLEHFILASSGFI